MIDNRNKLDFEVLLKAGVGILKHQKLLCQLQIYKLQRND
jgi:hypothetical protein